MSEPAALLLDLEVLRGVSLSWTAPTDETTLAYQIARVEESVQRDPQRLPRVLRALQLLARLALRDAPAWEESVAQLWPRQAITLIRRRKNAERSAGASVIGLAVRAVTSTDADGLCAQLEAVGASDAANDRELASIQVPVQIDLLFMGRGQAAVLAAVAAVAAFPGREDNTSAVRPYRITAIRSSAEDLQDPETLSQLALLGECGVRVPDFPVLDIRETTKHAATIASSFQRLLATRRSHHHAQENAPPIVERIRFPYRTYDPALSKLLTAVSDSWSVREVSLYHPERDWRPPATANPTEPTVAQWFAFSLFSRESHHRIQRFSYVTEPHRFMLPHEQIRDVLSADDPVAALFPQDADSIAQFAKQRLAASEFVLLDPSTSSGENEATADDSDKVQRWSHPHVELRILRESPEWWCVLLPAWGRAWVRREDATVTTVNLLAESGRHHWIPQIQLTMHSTTALAPTLSWLAFAGYGAKQASISRIFFARNRLWLDWQDAQSAFPNVSNFEVSHVEVDSLRGLTDRISRDVWPIEHLTLCNVVVREAHAGAAFFLEVLADDQHPMSKTLQSLTLTSTDSDAPHAEIVTAALRMLATNRTLSSFKLVVDGRRIAESPSETEELRAAFEAHNDTPCRSRSIREQLALLSVVSHPSTAPRCQILQRCDRPVFTSIFEFAGLCARRSVTLTIR